MEAYQERMLNEYEELKERRKKLLDFISNEKKMDSLSEDEQKDLREQYIYMKSYEVVLKRRIDRFLQN